MLNGRSLWQKRSRFSQIQIYIPGKGKSSVVNENQAIDKEALRNEDGMNFITF